MKLEIGDVVYCEKTDELGIVEEIEKAPNDKRFKIYWAELFRFPRYSGCVPWPKFELTLISKGDFKFEKGDVVYWEEYDTLAMVKYDEPFLSVNGVGCIFIDDGCIRPITICVLPKALTLISKGDFK